MKHVSTAEKMNSTKGLVDVMTLIFHCSVTTGRCGQGIVCATALILTLWTPICIKLAMAVLPSGYVMLFPRSRARRDYLSIYAVERKKDQALGPAVVERATRSLPAEEMLARMLALDMHPRRYRW